MFKPLLFFLLAVGSLSHSFAPSNTHQRVIPVHLATSVTASASFEDQFTKVQNDFQDISKQITA
jgi:hypothetical protein